ncbi:hypothetical protein K438DRAFT_1975797 [Mycena galopus ATCC 62051]|nr:hypothetical protein K438DRAFT_1991129 [Mycena galopus ATCC 62051]KAF8162340.1 hypothetical protein K438DRAFT_1985264 [Mycena galopus ATCC 62051]KAF8182270.1 hypothetical protein K438DRAFT_1975797 [Mycena galopus ATCC 62051]
MSSLGKPKKPNANAPAGPVSYYCTLPNLLLILVLEASQGVIETRHCQDGTGPKPKAAKTPKTGAETKTAKAKAARKSKAAVVESDDNADDDDQGHADMEDVLPPPVDYATEHRIGYALIYLALDQTSAGHPKLVNGPLQRDLNPAQTSKLAEQGLRGLLRDTVENALAISVDIAFIEKSSVTTSANGPFVPLVFTPAAKDGTMLLQAGQHRAAALCAILAPEIAQYQILRDSEDLSTEEKENLGKLHDYLRTHGTWLAALYPRALEQTPSVYYPLVLQISSNNGVTALQDTPEHLLHIIVRSIASVDETAVRAIRDWAATQEASDVRRLCTRYPDVIQVLAKLYRFKAFHRPALSPAALIKLKSCGWGVLVSLIEGMLNLVRYLASDKPLAFSPSSPMSRAEVEPCRKQLVNWFLEEPPFPYSQRIADAVINLASQLFDKHLKELMPLFGAGKLSKQQSSKWQTAYKSYIGELSQHWDVTLAQVGPLTSDERAIAILVPDKIRIFAKRSSVCAVFPMLPHFQPTSLPFLCPSLLVSLEQQIVQLTPVFRLLSHWIVPGITDMAKLRPNVNSIHTDTILSETEQILHHLKYHQHRYTPGSNWATTSADKMAQRPSNPTAAHPISNGVLVHNLFFLLIELAFMTRGTEILDLLPLLASRLWPKLDSVRDVALESTAAQQLVRGNWVKGWRAPYKTWGDASYKMAGLDGGAPVTKATTQLRLAQTCPAETAAKLPSLLVAFSEAASYNWTTFSSTMANRDFDRERFATTAAVETMIALTAHDGLLTEYPPLLELRHRALMHINDTFGLEHFKWWYKSTETWNPDKQSTFFKFQGDDFIAQAKQRATLLERGIEATAMLNRMVSFFSGPRGVGIPIDVGGPGKQKYAMHRKGRRKLLKFVHWFYEVTMDVQATYLGMEKYSLLQGIHGSADVSDEEDDEENTAEDADIWRSYRGLRTPRFATDADLALFLESSAIPFPNLFKGGRPLYPLPAGTEPDETILVPSTSQQGPSSETLVAPSMSAQGPNPEIHKRGHGDPAGNPAPTKRVRLVEEYNTEDEMDDDPDANEPVSEDVVPA